MFNSIRYKIGAILMKRAANLIETGEFNNIIKGLDLVKASVSIQPPSEELFEFRDKMMDLVNKYQKED